MMTLKFSRTTLMMLYCLIAPAFALAAQSTAVPLDKVVAIVNNSVITQSQVNNTIEIVKQQLQASGQPIPSDAVLRQKALDQAIAQTLQLQVAQRVKITVSDADLNNAISQIAQQNHLTTDQLKDALAKEGISFAQFRSQIHDQMLLHQVQQQALSNKVHITDADVAAYMKRTASANSGSAQYHIEDLLVPVSETAPQAEQDAATKQANEILQKARSGMSLQELVKQAPANTLQYTDMQWRMANQLPSLFSNQLPDLKAGGMAGPLKAGNGLHIIRLVDVQGQAKPLTNAQAKQALMQQKIQEQADIWVKELRKSAYIKIT